MKVRHTIAIVSCAFASACAVGGENEDVATPTEDSSEEVRVCATGETVTGIDVSKWQASVDFAQVKAAGHGFAFVRVSDGAKYEDPKFSTYWAAAKSAGLYRGAYQYYRASQSASEQARVMVEAVGKLGAGDLPPVLDIEELDRESSREVIDGIQTWIALVTAGTGRLPIVYTARYFWESQLGAPSGFGTYPLWVANYGVSCPSVPKSWSRWAFWQYTSTGSVKGISGNVDVNVFNGSLVDLAELAGAGASSTSTAATDGTAMRVTAKNLNLRSGPSTSHSIVSVLPCGTQVKELEPSASGWTKVMADGRTGYCSTSYLTEEAEFQQSQCE